jgi:hypothetical protein
MADLTILFSAKSAMMGVKSLLVFSSAVAMAVVVRSASLDVSTELVADSIRMVEDKAVLNITDAVSVKPVELSHATKTLQVLQACIFQYMECQCLPTASEEIEWPPP